MFLLFVLDKNIKPLFEFLFYFGCVFGVDCCIGTSTCVYLLGLLKKKEKKKKEQETNRKPHTSRESINSEMKRSELV